MVMANCTVMMTVENSAAEVTKYKCDTRQGGLLFSHVSYAIAKQIFDIGQLQKPLTLDVFFFLFTSSTNVFTVIHFAWQLQYV